MAFTLIRWVGRFVVACVAIWALVWRAVPPNASSSPTRAAMIELERAVRVAQAETRSEALRELAAASIAQNRSAALLRPPPTAADSDFRADDCAVREIEIEAVPVDGFLSPESCVWNDDLDRAEVFEFEVAERGWVEIDLTPVLRGSWRISLVDPSGNEIVARSAGRTGVTLSEWLDPGRHRIVVTGNYFGPGPFSLRLDRIGIDDLVEVALEEPSSGGGVARLRPWGRVVAEPGRVLFLDGSERSAVYDGEGWFRLPTALVHRDQSIVAGQIRDMISVTELTVDPRAVVRLGETATGSFDVVDSGYVVWSMPVPDSAYITVEISGSAGVRGWLFDSSWKLVGHGTERFTALVTPGTQRLVLAFRSSVERYEVSPVVCGRYTTVHFGRTLPTKPIAHPACESPADVFKVSAPGGRFLDYDWGGDPNPPSFRMFSPDGRLWGRNGDLRNVEAAEINIVTERPATFPFTIHDRGDRLEYLEGVIEDYAASVRVAGARPSMVAVGRERGIEGVPSAFGYRNEGYYVGADPSAAYCTRLLRPWETLGSGSAAELLGNCWVFAHFGAPGAEVMAWLQSGGLTFSGSMFESELAEEGGRPSRRGEYGEFPRRNRYSPVAEACRSGERAACGEAILLSSVSGRESRPDRVSPGFSEDVEYGIYMYSKDRSLFADLIAEFGERRFLTFWQSEAEVAGAFQAAFGVPAEDWMLAWTLERFEPTEPARDLTLLDMLVSLMLMAGLGAVAGALQGRVEASQPVPIVAEGQWILVRERY